MGIEAIGSFSRGFKAGIRGESIGSLYKKKKRKKKIKKKVKHINEYEEDINDIWI